jgi:hypothetical protein
MVFVGLNGKIHPGTVIVTLITLVLLGVTGNELLHRGLNSQVLPMLSLITLMFLLGSPLIPVKRDLKTNILLSVGTFAVGLVIINGVLGWMMHRGADTRSKLQVVQELRAQQIKAYPNIAPHHFLKDPAKFLKKHYPLNTLPNALTVMCNESGPWVSYHTDDHGFYNPSPVWNAPVMDVMFIGDSFTNGLCVPEDQHFVAQVRNRVPKTLNLGLSGHGPLLELATLQEYFDRKPAKTVFWVYYEGNDLFRGAKASQPDLAQELEGNPILRRYLDPAFRQPGLADQQKINRFLVNYAEKKVDSKSREYGPFLALFPVYEFFSDQLTLKHIRDLTDAYSFNSKPLAADHRERMLTTFDKILGIAQNTVKRQDGELVLVYLPSLETFYSGKPHPLYHDVLALAKKQNIPVVDVYAGFLHQPQPKALFPRVGGHYTSEGNTLVARQLLDYLHPALASEGARP